MIKKSQDVCQMWDYTNVISLFIVVKAILSYCTCMKLNACRDSEWCLTNAAVDDILDQAGLFKYRTGIWAIASCRRESSRDCIHYILYQFCVMLFGLCRSLVMFWEGEALYNYYICMYLFIWPCITSLSNRIKLGDIPSGTNKVFRKYHTGGHCTYLLVYMLLVDLLITVL